MDERIHHLSGIVAKCTAIDFYAFGILYFLAFSSSAFVQWRCFCTPLFPLFVLFAAVVVTFGQMALVGFLQLHILCAMVLFEEFFV